MLHRIDDTNTSTRSHYKMLSAARKGQARKIDSIPGDGNCLFRALTKELFGQEDGHVTVRSYISRFSSLNKDIWHLSFLLPRGLMTTFANQQSKGLVVEQWKL